jgi:hypothetical protein
MYVCTSPVDGNTHDSKPNSNKLSAIFFYSLFIFACNFNFLLSFPNFKTLHICRRFTSHLYLVIFSVIFLSISNTSRPPSLLATRTSCLSVRNSKIQVPCNINPLKAELNPICYLLALLAQHFLHVSRIGGKSLTLRLLMSYIYGAPILDVSRSHTTTQHSR